MPRNSLAGIGQSLTRALAPPKKLSLKNPLNTKSLTNGLVPGGLSGSMEDALMGIKPFDRRKTVAGSLGIKTSRNAIGSPLHSTRPRKF
jgi:hypothetical protein